MEQEFSYLGVPGCAFKTADYLIRANSYIDFAVCSVKFESTHVIRVKQADEASENKSVSV